MLKPESKDILMKLTMIAKMIVYDTERMKTFTKLVSDPDGAITAVKAVTAVIRQKKSIPADIAPLLDVNIYVLIVDLAQDATGAKANPEFMAQVIASLLKGAGATIGQQQPQEQPAMPEQAAEQPPQQPMPEQMPQQPPGLIAQGV